MAEGRAVRLVVVGEDGEATETDATLPVTFGRDPAQVDVAILDRMVSRRHARLEADDTTVTVVDLDSGNGTWVGGEEVRRRTLAPGEEIVLGSSTVRWSCADPDPAPPEDPEDRELGAAWVIVVGEHGLRHLPLAELLAAWAQAAGHADGVEARAAGTDDGALIGALARESAALDALLDGAVAELAAWTLAACAPTGDPAAFRVGLARWRARPEHGRARATAAMLRDRAGGPTPDPTLRLVLAEQRRTCARVATALRDGAAAFVRLGPRVLPDGVETLASALRAILDALVERDRRIVAHGRAAGFAV